jgi:hypothetical protein
MRVSSTCGVVVLLTACSPAPIGEYPDTPDGIDRPAPNNTDTDGGLFIEAGSSGKTFQLTVTLAGSGTGTVSSTPSGVTCLGKICTGTFAAGATIGLVAAPASGSMFVGWSGGCTGNGACTPVMNADINVTATIETSPVGTFAGTYTNTQQLSGCTLNNSGNLTITITAEGAGFASTASITGVERRQLQGCALIAKTTGTSPNEAIMLNGATATGTWTFTLQGGSGTFAFPYTATLAGNQLSGSWTCPTCSGSFTLTKQ